MNDAVKILGSDGLPLSETPKRSSMLAGRSNIPYDAANNDDSHMAAWNPYLGSPDGDLNVYRDKIVSRVRDLVRNDGWASGGVTRILDNAIGANFRPVSKPDHRALTAYTGNKAFDATWADEFGRAVEANWRMWAHDTGRYCDAQRNMSVAQILRLGFRHKLIDGDALAIIRWMPERVGLGRARYATAVQIVDPDRLSNPQLQFDQHTMRGGVEIDADGAAVAYWIRRAHQGDWYSASDSIHWDRIPRETEWGRAIVVHDFDHDRADQNRGGAGILAPVLKRFKMLSRYDDTELDAAIINAIFGAYIESPYDRDMVEGALGGGESLSAYQEERKGFHDERKIALGGASMPILFPGEKINAVSAARPNSNFRDFEGAVLRNAAAGMGISAQQLSQDWSETNYSSARAALLEAWKTLTRRRIDFSVGFADPIFCAFLEEAMECDDLPLPAGAPDFIECRTAYARCRWLGPGRGWVDPVAEKEGAVIGMDAGLSTLEAECAENVGEDWEDVLNQRALEIKRFKDLGIPLPQWSGIQNKTAMETAKKPEAV